MPFVSPVFEKEVVVTFAPTRVNPEPLVVLRHRRENFGEGFESICQALATIAEEHQDVEIVYPVHLNPNVDARTHAKITTGTYENKFGIAFEDVQAIYARAAKLKRLHLRALQMLIGSQPSSSSSEVAASARSALAVREHASA